MAADRSAALASMEESLPAVPDRQAEESFIHKLYDSKNVYMGTITTYITGVYSQADNHAQITSITAVFDGGYANKLSYSTSLSGNRGVVTINMLNAAERISFF